MSKKRRCYNNCPYRKNSVNLLVATLTSMGTIAHADSPLGLVGGEDQDSNAYGAFLTQNNELTPISGLPADGNSVMNAVAFNASGTGLLAGRSGLNGYAAFVNTNGIITPFTISFANGSLTNAGISASGLGLIGGYSVANTSYAAQILADGTINVLPVPLDSLESLAINDSGVGLIGGEGSAIAYATYVAPDGTLTPVSTPTMDAGHIYTVSINNAGEGVIGGWSGSSFYAALVTPNGTASPLSSLPMDFGIIYSSAINSSGAALIGGTDSSNIAYLGYVSSSGAVTPLFETPFTGTINHAALNDSGVGLVAGDDSGNVYAALVQPDGSLTSLFNSPMSGTINGVAINEQGIGLLGGNISGSYLTLVAPNGALTPINVASGGSIQDVSILNVSGPGPTPPPILDKVVPSSMGPYSSAIYTQLAANLALNARIIQKNKIWSRKYTNESSRQKISQNQHNFASNEELLAYNDEKIPPSSRQDYLAFNLTTKSMPKRKMQTPKKNSIWLEPFGNFVHLKEQGSTPSYTNKVGGVLLGYDRENSNYIVGATLGYAFNYIQYSKSLGHGKIQEEMTSVYGSYYTDNFWIASAIWGGLYQFNNTRHTLSQITSKGHTHGWILAPNLEIASPWKMGQSNNYYVEPFASLDWINNWQSSFTETGASGLNLKMPSIYDSFLQSEFGLRFYERFVCGSGDFCLEEKLSYVNQAPFDFNSATASFVSSSSSFPIAIGSSKVQNLGAFQILGAFIPRKSSFSTGFSLQVTAGNSYQSYFGSLFAAVDF